MRSLVLAHLQTEPPTHTSTTLTTFITTITIPSLLTRPRRFAKSPTRLPRTSCVAPADTVLPTDTPTTSNPTDAV